MTIEWEKFRRPDGSIDLVSAFDTNIRTSQDFYFAQDSSMYGDAVKYLKQVEHLQPIYSRQAAAVALGVAFGIHGSA